MSWKKRSLAAGVETHEQLEACLEFPELSFVYVDMGYFSPAEMESALSDCHKKGIGCAARFPHIFRREAAELMDKALKRLEGFDAFIIRSLEELGYINEKFSREGRNIPPLIFDYTIYAFNKRSMDFLAGLSPVVITLPLELNMRELKYETGEFRKYIDERADAPETELVVYGRIPMMVTAQCVKKTVKGCDRTPTVLYLKDRTGSLMPVKNNCSFCYNTILNSKPTVLYDLSKDLERIGADRYRLEFTTESFSETKNIIEDALCGTRSVLGQGAFTRGHFKRGVE